MPESIAVDYEVRLDFERGTPDPSRVFVSMARLVDAFQEFDRHLAQSISADFAPVVLLQDVAAGSIRSILRTLIESVDDEALKEFSWQKLVGSYLLKGKKRLLEFLADKKEITSRDEIKELEDSLRRLAEQTNVRHIPAYRPIPTRQLVSDVAELGRAVRPLRPNDSVTVLLEREDVPLSKSFSVPDEALEHLITHEVISSATAMILQVKRPDYLGRAMWEFKHGGRIVEAKILDENWLGRFQHRAEVVHPGDALRAVVETRVGYDRSGAAVLTR